MEGDEAFADHKKEGNQDPLLFPLVLLSPLLPNVLPPDTGAFYDRFYGLEKLTIVSNQVPHSLLNKVQVVMICSTWSYDLSEPKNDSSSKGS